MLKTLYQWLYPPRCLLCQQAGFNQLDICEACYQALPFIEHACQQCALPLACGDKPRLLCGHCLQKPPAFDSSLSVLHYKAKTVPLVSAYQFHDRLAYSRLLAELMLARLAHAPRPECVIAVPLHLRRLRARGFNQSHELAKMIAARLQLPVLTDCVLRIRDTPQQTGLDAKQRRKNIRGAFAINGAFPYKHVALIDDVVTTGSTVNELARLLKKNGVQSVAVWSLARAV